MKTLRPHLLLAALLLLSVVPAPARLGEDAAASNLRFGAHLRDPGTLGAIASAPLVLGAKERRYNYKGWTIAIAFVRDEEAQADQAIAIRYQKSAELAAKTGAPGMQPAEIEAILKANTINPDTNLAEPWEPYSATPALFALFVENPLAADSSLTSDPVLAVLQAYFRSISPAPAPETIRKAASDFLAGINAYPNRWATPSGFLAVHSGGTLIVQRPAAALALLLARKVEEKKKQDAVVVPHF